MQGAQGATSLEVQAEEKAPAGQGSTADLKPSHVNGRSSSMFILVDERVDDWASHCSVKAASMMFCMTCKMQFRALAR